MVTHPIHTPRSRASGTGSRKTRSSTALTASETTRGSAAQGAHTKDKARCCYICLEPCVPGTDSLVTREDAHSVICRFTVNGIRVGPDEPCTSIVRGTHYARPSAFECYECDACVCCLCMYRHLLAGIKAVGNHAIKCACGKVPLINDRTLLFLTPEQERQLFLRCDEWRCPDPLYCPIPTCSAYIPMLQCLMPGASADDKGVRQGPRVSCVQCQTPICTQCKGRADDLAHSGPDERCRRPNVHGSQELKTLMWKSGFRQCPQCLIGIEQVAGLCHKIHCTCGTVFCFQCAKRIERCRCDYDEASAPGSSLGTEY